MKNNIFDNIEMPSGVLLKEDVMNQSKKTAEEIRMYYSSEKMKEVNDNLLNTVKQRVEKMKNHPCIVIKSKPLGDYNEH